MLVLLAASMLVAASALLVAARLADGSVTQFVNAALTIASAEIVLVSLALSPGHHLTRWALLGVLTAVLLIAVGSTRGTRFPPIRRAARDMRVALHDPVLALLAIAVAGVLAYSFALAVFTPPNDQDAIEYHLARAAFWKQQHAVAFIDGAGDPRLNGFPPNAEILMAFTMIASASVRYAPLVQLIAALGAAAAVYGIARRIGLDLRAALFSASVFVTLPVVALQASSGLNDVVVAWLVASSVFYLLKPTASNLVLAGISVALLIGTKVTGPLALPVLLMVALAAPRSRRIRALVSVAAGAAAGSYWYLVNLVETGHSLGGFGGGLESSVAAPAEHDIGYQIANVIRLVLDTIETPGAVGLDRLLYVGAAVAAAVAVFNAPAGSRARATRVGLAAAVAVLPLLLAPVGRLLVRGAQKTYFELGRPELTLLDPDRSLTKASPIFSWYGAVGFLLMLLSLALLVRPVRRGQLRALALIFAVCPFVWIVMVGILVTYNDWNGRYTIGGFALASATWGIVAGVRPIAWAVAMMTLVTSVLIMVHRHDKPAGLRLLEDTDTASVWTQPEAIVETKEARGEAAAIRFVHDHVPKGVPIAIYSGEVDGRRVWPLPFFGRDLSRRVSFVTTARAAAEAGAAWAILPRDTCASGWRPVFRGGSLAVLRRDPRAACRAR